jgi:NADP-dependent aldehyde dehydrogenase
MISGKNLIEGKWEHNSNAEQFQTVNPKTNESLSVAYQQASNDQIDLAVNAASESFDFFGSTTFNERVFLLESIQEGMHSYKSEIIATYRAESALPEGRANGEFQRTIDQIQSFIQLLNEGSFIAASIYTKGPDLRKMFYPIGPIVVFGASNFPLAFSTAGGDTIAAFAAGCPVIVKAHPYHAGTSELVAQVIIKAIKKCNLPLGIFSHLGGKSHEVGSLLVSHPLIKGVGFTGSFSGGKALYDLVQKRNEPIPVFAEMGSINPIFILENKLKKDCSVLAEDLAQSVTLGTGQFCTNPGLIVICDPSGTINLAKKISESITDLELPPMVHSNIQKQYDKQLATLKTKDKLDALYSSESCSATIGSVKAFKFLNDHSLREEVFGPFSLVVECNSTDEILNLAASLEGQLTITLLGETSDQQVSKKLLSLLKTKAGRILFHGVPTGVAVIQTMQHGGPYPASTDSRFTSVGTDSIYRWLRPVAFQDCPNDLLPDALKNENPLKLERKVDGKMNSAAL